MNLRTVLPGLLAVLASSGCLSIQTIDVTEALARYEPPPIDTPERLGREVVVYVVSSPSMGGVILETKPPEKAKELGSYTAELFPIVPGRDADEQIEARIDELNGKGVLSGIEVEGFAETLGQRLRERLEERFEKVTVRRVESFDADKGIVVKARAESYMEVIPTLDKRSFVRLQATLDKEKTVFVKGEGSVHVHRGHLIWAIPATVLSATTIGVPGLIGVHFGLYSLEKDALADSLVEGIDDAARKLAEKLAEQPDQPVPLQLERASP